MRIRNYFKQKKSKKGLTLVEVLCAIFVLAIVFVGVLNAVAFSRQMVFSNNSREKASFRGQLVADEVLSICTGLNPTNVDDLTTVATKVDGVLNDMSDPQNNDSETAVGKVERVNTLSDPASFNPGDSGAVGNLQRGFRWFGHIYRSCRNRLGYYCSCVLQRNKRRFRFQMY